MTLKQNCILYVSYLHGGILLNIYRYMNTLCCDFPALKP